LLSVAAVVVVLIWGQGEALAVIEQQQGYRFLAEVLLL
jgi:hypothetical protein